MKLVFIFLVLFLFGCDTAQKKPVSSRPSVKVTWDEIKPETVISGRTFHFDDLYTPRSLDKETNGKITNIIRKKMLDLGYEEVKVSRKAYVSILISADWEKLAEDDVKSVKTTETRIEKDGTVHEFATTAKKLARFTMALYTNNYGKRPTLLGWLSVKAPSEEWLGFEDQLLFSIERDFPALIKAAPAANQKMAGDPGCMPSFGYVADEETGIVLKIWEKSPAERAGIKVGDQILSIDSMSPEESARDAKLYEEAIKVPVKFKRGDRILRSEMKAELLCR